MIYDKIENLEKYLLRDDFTKIAEAVKTIDPDTAPFARQPLDGSHIQYMLLDYDTKDVSECAPEAHEVYTDIMIGVAGAEGLDLYAREELAVTVPYDAADDILWLENGGNCLGHCDLLPGYFVMVRPDEAHRTKQHAQGCMHVKKIVIKLAE